MGRAIFRSLIGYIQNAQAKYKHKKMPPIFSHCQLKPYLSLSFASLIFISSLSLFVSCVSLFRDYACFWFVYVSIFVSYMSLLFLIRVSGVCFRGCALRHKSLKTISTLNYHASLSSSVLAYFDLLIPDMTHMVKNNNSSITVLAEIYQRKLSKSSYGFSRDIPKKAL